MSDADFLRELFPNASPDFLNRNTGSPAELERHSRDGAVGQVQVQKRTGRRFLVRVVSYRKRLLDEDNLAEKYHVDLCRYAGILPSDEAGTTQIQTSQVKTVKGEEERVLIEVFEIVSETPNS